MASSASMSPDRRRSAAIASFARPWQVGLIALAALCLAAEAAVLAGLVSPLVVPRPSAVAEAVARLAGGGALVEAFVSTFAVTLAAIGIACLLGVPAGVLLYRLPAFGRAYESWLGALFAAPLILLYPLFLVVFGRNYLTILVMGVITGIVPVVLNTRIGLLSVPRPLVHVGTSFNCSPLQQFFKVLLPAAGPSIFTGVRLGLIYALVNIIGIEFLINFGGLGNLVSQMYDRFDIPAMYAAILFVILVSASIFAALGWMERRLRPE